jgi:hypothetical protein
LIVWYIVVILPVGTFLVIRVFAFSTFLVLGIVNLLMESWGVIFLSKLQEPAIVNGKSSCEAVSSRGNSTNVHDKIVSLLGFLVTCLVDLISPASFLVLGELRVVARCFLHVAVLTVEGLQKIVCILSGCTSLLDHIISALAVESALLIGLGSPTVVVLWED